MIATPCADVPVLDTVADFAARNPTAEHPPGLAMKRQTSGLCLLLSLLFVWWTLAPHDVHLEFPQPAVTVTTP